MVCLNGRHVVLATFFKDLLEYSYSCHTKKNRIVTYQLFYKAISITRKYTSLINSFLINVPSVRKCIFPSYRQGRN